MKVTYTIQKILYYVYGITFLLLLIGAEIGGGIVTRSNYQRIAYFLIAAVLLAVLWFVMTKKIVTWIQGAMGETVVRTLIEDMWRDGVRGLEDVRYDNGGKANIDHIAVAPSGVWVIEVKYWDPTAKVTCDDQGLRRAGKSCGAQILKGCFAASKKVEGVLQDAGVKVPVKPVLVIASHAKVRNGLKECDGVIVIGRSWLRKIIVEDGSNNVLTSIQIAGIQKLLREKSLTNNDKYILTNDKY